MLLTILAQHSILDVLQCSEYAHEVRFGGFIVNFEHISHLCSSVSIFNFEHVIAGWDYKNKKRQWNNSKEISKYCSKKKETTKKEK